MLQHHSKRADSSVVFESADIYPYAIDSLIDIILETSSSHVPLPKFWCEHWQSNRQGLGVARGGVICMPTWACHAERPFTNRAPNRDSPCILGNLGKFLWAHRDSHHDYNLYHPQVLTLMQSTVHLHEASV